MFDETDANTAKAPSEAVRLQEYSLDPGDLASEGFELLRLKMLAHKCATFRVVAVAAVASEGAGVCFSGLCVFEFHDIVVL